ncbi:hypothetical protein GALMADRAFT_148487 [Galerina marginata CBS 339.88]|uniref:Uncharacterized protein n=1 Tax=Galerina marginata (strain CBS 339.88) TaxID=685588 RepID=A0A067SD40_GALM3|nr:hypothetical protein GALMADRAFT_148487 [Galerina marginata CBS 339.88]
MSRTDRRPPGPSFPANRVCLGNNRTTHQRHFDVVDLCPQPRRLSPPATPSPVPTQMRSRNWYHIIKVLYSASRPPGLAMWTNIRRIRVGVEGWITRGESLAEVDPPGTCKSSLAARFVSTVPPTLLPSTEPLRNAGSAVLGTALVSSPNPHHPLRFDGAIIEPSRRHDRLRRQARTSITMFVLLAFHQPPHFSPYPPIDVSQLVVHITCELRCMISFALNHRKLSAQFMVSNKEAEELKVKYKHEYYYRNIQQEREKARLRARRQKAQPVSAEVTLARQTAHREAQARYREKNRMKLKNASWQYRLGKKRDKGRLDDEDEYQRLMAVDLDSLE